MNEQNPTARPVLPARIFRALLWPAGAAVLLGSLLGCAEPAADQPAQPFVLTPMGAYNVPQLGHNQGNVTDFNTWWQLDTSSIFRWSRQGGAFTLQASNNVPFGRLLVNHIAPGYINSDDRQLYGIANDAGSQGKSRVEYILAFDPLTLARTAAHQVIIPAEDGGEGGGGALTGICLVPQDGAHGTIYAADYYTNRVYRFDAASFAYLGFVQLKAPIVHLQGICFSHGYLIADSDTMDRIFWIDRQTGAVVNSVSIGQTLPQYGGVPEGICALGTEVVLTIERKSTNAFVLGFIPGRAR